MKSREEKTRSTFQSHVNRLRNRCNEYQEAIRKRNAHLSQYNNFITLMLEKGKITKGDLKDHFKKKNQL